MNRSVYAYTKRNSLELVKYHRSVKFNTERSLRYFLIRGRKRGKLVTCRVYEVTENRPSSERTRNACAPREKKGNEYGEGKWTYRKYRQGGEGGIRG